ncbi:MAG: hypothetical protein ABI882_06745, partial [Acidobacteriota bacterium]
GKLSASKSKAGIWRIHLVPVDIAQADNALVYYESNSTPDGGFALTNIAPGKYWIAARSVPQEDAPDSIRPVAWEAAERAKLRREAEMGKKEVTLKSCERLKDYVLE